MKASKWGKMRKKARLAEKVFKSLYWTGGPEVILVLNNTEPGIIVRFNKFVAKRTVRLISRQIINFVGA